MTRRVFLKVMATVASGAVAAGCAPSLTRSLPLADNPKELVYQDWQTDWFAEMAQSMLEQFHATHPNIQVFFTPDPDRVEEQMITDFEAGTAPDVLVGCCDFMPIWAQKGYLLDLRPYIEADLSRDTVEDWDPAQYKALSTRSGIQFGLPKYHGALGLLYNKDLFDQYGIDYPDGTWDHDDYLDAMRLFMRDRSRFGHTSLRGSMLDISWERIQVHVNGWGGHFVDPQDATRSMMAETEALAAMNWIRDRMWLDHTMAGPLEVKNLETRHAFIQQHIAMVEDGSWALKDIFELAPFGVGVAPFPAGPAKKVTLATTDGFAIYSGTKHPEAAWELLKFLVSRDYGRAMARMHLLQPARASLVDEWIGTIRQQYPQKSDNVDIAAFAEGHLRGYSVTAEIFENMAEARRLIKGAWEQIFTLGRAPVSLMNAVSAQIQQAQQEAA